MSSQCKANCDWLVDPNDARIKLCRRRGCTNKMHTEHPPERCIASCNSPDAPSQGLGDTIAKITTALGIEPCGGCKDRQETLNRLFPYKQRD